MNDILTVTAQNCIQQALGMATRSDLEDIAIEFENTEPYSQSGPFNCFHGRKHTSESKKLMSEKKIGLFQAKDSNGKSVGLIRSDDARYVSGEYTHINKGMKHSEEFKKNRSIE